MVICCVLHCSESSNRNKNSDVRFYEFPSNSEMRKKWLECIGRKDWVPKDSTKICSLHFHTDDFRQCKGRKLLQRHAFPTIFPTYKLPCGPKRFKPAILLASSLTKKKPNLAVACTPSKKKPVVSGTHWTQMISNNSSEAEVPSQNELVEVGNVDEIAAQKIHPSLATTVDSQCSEAAKAILAEEHDYSVQINSTVEVSGQNLEDPPATQLVPVSQLPNDVQKLQQDHNSTRHFCRIPLKGRPKMATSELRLRLRQNTYLISGLKKKISLLNKQLENQNQVDKRSSTSLFKQVDKIQQDAANDVSAQFLLDQISCYRKKIPRYSKSTILTCLNWRKKFPKGYSHMVSSKLLTLPSRQTLSSYMKIKQQNGSGNKSLLEKLLTKPNNQERDMDKTNSLQSSEDEQQRILSNAIQSICKDQA